jgi:hypothetical protein
MSDQTARIMCPNLSCKKILVVPVSSRGKTVRCKSCSTTIRVPLKALQPAPDAPAGDQKAA